MIKTHQIMLVIGAYYMMQDDTTLVRTGVALMIISLIATFILWSDKHKPKDGEEDKKEDK